MEKQKLFLQGMFKLVFYQTVITLFLSMSIRLCYSDMPSVFTTIDPLLNDLTAKAPAFEVDLEFEYGSNPVPSFIYLGTGNQPTLAALLEANLDLFVQKKVPWVDFAAIEGGGLLWFNSPTLLLRLDRSTPRSPQKIAAETTH